MNRHRGELGQMLRPWASTPPRGDTAMQPDSQNSPGRVQWRHTNVGVGDQHARFCIPGFSLVEASGTETRLRGWACEIGDRRHVWFCLLPAEPEDGGPELGFALIGPGFLRVTSDVTSGRKYRSSPKRNGVFTPISYHVDSRRRARRARARSFPEFAPAFPAGRRRRAACPSVVG